jgi:type I restriction enzyme M protein
MRDVLPSNIVARQGDTLDKDWPYFDETDPDSTYDYLTVDACCSNPPYSQPWEPRNDPRFDNFGLAPKSKADYAFLLHNLYNILLSSNYENKEVYRMVPLHFYYSLNVEH